MTRAAQELHMKLLQIDSRARAGSITRRLTTQFAGEWKTNHPNGEVMQRDLSKTVLPLITDDWNATQIEPSKLSPEHRKYLSASARRGTASGGAVGSRARRSRWLRPKALPPRAPMRRSCSGDLLHRT